MSRESYIEWALTRSREMQGHLKTLNAALWSKAFADLQHEVNPDLSDDACAWLAGIASEMRYTHPKIEKTSKSGFVYRWATQSPDLREIKRIDINERRFERWIKANNWEDFYKNTLEALLVIKGLDFDVGALYDIAILRDKFRDAVYKTEGFQGRMALEFYNHQPGGINKMPPAQITTNEIISGNQYY